MVLFLLACTPDTADIRVEGDDCPTGEVLAADGNCYATEGDADTDADSDADADADSDSDTDDTGTPVPVDSDEDGTPDDEDCAPQDATRHPGAEEVCDGLDNDCDATTDEGVTGTYYLDSDGDGYGDASATGEACEVSGGWSVRADDCDDAAADVHPGAPDDTHDETDNDCDGAIDEDWDPCAEALGALDHSMATYTASEALWVDTTISGYGYLCDVTCPDWWFQFDGLTYDDGATFEALPALVAGEAEMRWTVLDAGVDADTSCTMRTSAGDIELAVRWRG